MQSRSTGSGTNSCLPLLRITLFNDCRVFHMKLFSHHFCHQIGIEKQCLKEIEDYFKDNVTNKPSTASPECTWLLFVMVLTAADSGSEAVPLSI